METPKHSPPMPWLSHREVVGLTALHGLLVWFDESDPVVPYLIAHPAGYSTWVSRESCTCDRLKVACQLLARRARENHMIQQTVDAMRGVGSDGESWQFSVSSRQLVLLAMRPGGVIEHVSPPDSKIWTFVREFSSM